MIAFISYSHVDREYARQAKQVLEEVGVTAFLAHEDLEVSEEWKERILEELKICDLFVPLLSKNCGFHSIPITHSIPFRSRIPRDSDHSFHGNSISDSV